MRDSAWRFAVALGLAAIAAYYLTDSALAQSVIYTALGLFSVACILVGVRLHRPDRPLGWLAMAAANVFFVAGDAILDYYDLVLHHDPPLPSIADALYLAGYPCLVLSVVLLTRSAQHRGSREDRADAAIVTVGALALSWHLLVGADAHDATVSLLGKLVTMAYPIMDIGVLFIVVHALFGAPVRHSAARLLALGLAAMLIADFGYDLLVLHDAASGRTPIDAGWLVSYLLLGAAALHPTMKHTVSQREASPERRGRLPLVALAAFVAPSIILVSTLTGAAVDAAVLAGISILLFLLVIARVTWLLTRMHEQTLVLSRQSVKLRDALRTQRELEGDLRHQAFHDSLTGLANRALLHERAGHALVTSARGPGMVAVIFCDLDGFKNINDSLGHQVGDDLLQVVGKRLLSVVRAEDTVARLGGDEFAVLMDNIVDPIVALTTAERIVAVVRQPIEQDALGLRVSASVGISFGTATKSVEVLLSEADAAMYAAKAGGKDRVASFEEQMRVSTTRRLTLRNSFETGLQNGDFFVQYQPHVSLPAGRLEGFEALLRWQHPVLGLVGPDEFIPLAEESGFIIPLGRWVLEAACAAAVSWQRAGEPPLTIAVNISARQLQDRHLVDDVAAALAMSGLEPHQLVLEVTEGMLMADPAATAAVLTRLKTSGIRVAIDDFGTGYSSLSYLRQFPVDIIKIDKSFVDPLADPTNEADAFVDTIIRLAHELQLTTVAEGIEDRVQRQALIDLGCDSAQGYLMSRPFDEADARQFALRSEAADLAAARAPLSA